MYCFNLKTSSTFVYASMQNVNTLYKNKFKFCILTKCIQNYKNYYLIKFKENPKNTLL